MGGGGGIDATFRDGTEAVNNKLRVYMSIYDLKGEGYLVYWLQHMVLVI